MSENSAAQCAFLHAITTMDGETALGQITAIWFGENTKNTFTQPRWIGITDKALASQFGGEGSSPAETRG